MNDYEENEYEEFKVVPQNFGPMIQQTLFDFMSSIIFQELLNNDASMRDFSFLMRCKSLNFIKVQDLLQKEDPNGRIAYMGSYLESVTEDLKRMDEGGSLYMVLECIEQAMTGIVDLFHVVLGNKEPPGSEDILPIFLFCVQRANLERMLSIFYFLDLMMIKEERRGKGGFNLTQVETGISFVEHLSARALGYDEIEFEGLVMKMEVCNDIHRYRLRKPHRYRPVKSFELDDEYSLF